MSRHLMPVVLVGSFAPCAGVVLGPLGSLGSVQPLGHQEQQLECLSHAGQCP